MPQQACLLGDFIITSQISKLRLREVNKTIKLNGMRIGSDCHSSNSDILVWWDVWFFEREAVCFFKDLWCLLPTLSNLDGHCPAGFQADHQCCRHMPIRGRLEQGKCCPRDHKTTMIRLMLGLACSPIYNHLQMIKPGWSTGHRITGLKCRSPLSGSSQLWHWVTRTRGFHFPVSRGLV